MGVCGRRGAAGDTHAGGSDAGGAIGTALAAVAAHLAGEGIDVIAADPEVAATDAAYARGACGRRVPRHPRDPALAPPDGARAARPTGTGPR